MKIEMFVRGAVGVLALFLLAGSGAARAQAQAEGGAAAQGYVIQANPWRTEDGLEVRVDYLVQLGEGAAATPGTVLTAWRQSRIGRAEGPPLVKVGYLAVIASAGNVAVARAVPVRSQSGPHLEVPVVVVGDLVRPDGDMRGWGPAGSSLELSRLFPAGDAVLGKDADKALAELVKPAGNGPGQLVLVVYDSPAASGATKAPGAAYEQASVVSRRVAEMLSLDEASVHAAVVPMPAGGRPVIELRVLPRAAAGSKPERTGAP